MMYSHYLITNNDDGLDRHVVVTSRHSDNSYMAVGIKLISSLSYIRFRILCYVLILAFLLKVFTIDTWRFHFLSLQQTLDFNKDSPST